MPGTFVVELHAGPVLVPLLVGVVIVWLLALGHRRALTWGRALTVLATSVYGAALVVVTALPPLLALRPGLHVEALRSLVNVVPLATIDLRGFVLNIVMTVPLGVLLPLLVRVRSVAGAALAGLLVSASIEGMQGVADLLLDLGRTVDVNDLIANVTGTVVGLLCFRAAARVAAPALARFAMPGSTASAASAAADQGRPQTGSGWLVDDPEEVASEAAATWPTGAGATSSPLAGASTATTPAASRAVPKMRSPNSA